MPTSKNLKCDILSHFQTICYSVKLLLLQDWPQLRPEIRWSPPLSTVRKTRLRRIQLLPRAKAEVKLVQLGLNEQLPLDVNCHQSRNLNLHQTTPPTQMKENSSSLLFYCKSLVVVWDVDSKSTNILVFVDLHFIKVAPSSGIKGKCKESWAAKIYTR